ncbi:hypothetical protein, partial [Nocardia farcinica]|uniref:hypothetical protein n=1 Tax=Nocardia farcinica TaxID=37329 RepID=UPI0024576BA7
MTSPPRPTTVPTLAGLTVLFAVAFGVLTHNVVDRSGLTVIDPEVSGWAVTQRNAVLTPLAHFLSAIGGTLPMTVVATAVTLLLYRAGGPPPPPPRGGGRGGGGAEGGGGPTPKRRGGAPPGGPRGGGG